MAMAPFGEQSLWRFSMHFKEATKSWPECSLGGFVRRELTMAVFGVGLNVGIWHIRRHKQTSNTEITNELPANMIKTIKTLFFDIFRFDGIIQRCCSIIKDHNAESC